MGYENLVVERRGAIATIRLNRPEKHNALNTQISHELIDCLDSLEADESVQVIVLTGSGEKAFCAGADMAEAIGDRVNGGYVGAPAQATARLLRLRKPVIAAVNGYAYGGGAVLAINCDIRIASENARFRFVGTSYGLVVGASQLPRIVGSPKAKELIFTTRTIDAAEALRIGLANHVVPLEQLEATALDMAQAIAENSPTAVQASKRVIDIATANKDAARQEAESNAALRETEEHRERFRAAAERLTGGK